MWAWLAKAANNVRKGRDFYKENTSQKTRIRLGQAVAIIIVILFALAMSRRFIEAARKYIHKDVRKIEYNSTNLSYDKSEYSSFCSTLEAAMNYGGTDEDSIKDVMRKMKNQDDWNFTMKTFGIRKKDGGFWTADITGDLKTWIIDELGDDDRQEVRDILAVNNVNF